MWRSVVRTFSEYHTIKARNINTILNASEELRFQLNPHQYFVTQGKGYERPYTGDYWWVKDVGNYHCIVCHNLLFPSHYKFFPNTGHAAFFASKKDATIIENENEVKCTSCSAHLGHVLEDGPFPTKKHY